jgi:hypothetical protein
MIDIPGCSERTNFGLWCQNAIQMLKNKISEYPMQPGIESKFSDFKVLPF